MVPVKLTDAIQVLYKSNPTFVELRFGDITFASSGQLYERWHAIRPISLNPLALVNDHWRAHSTNHNHKTENCRSFFLVCWYLVIQGFIYLYQVLLLFRYCLNPSFIPRPDVVWGLNVEVNKDLAVLCEPLANVRLICSHSVGNDKFTALCTLMCG